MARKRLRKTEQEPQKEKKETGKSVKQSGSWFQRNKALITWALAIAFASTCIGFGAISFIAGGGNEKESKKPADQQAADEIANNLKYWRDRVGDSPEDATALANLAFAYQEAALKTKSFNPADKLKPEDKTKYQEYLKSARDNYEKSLKKDPTYAFATTNLADIYLLEGKNREAVKLLKNFSDSMEQVEKTGHNGKAPDLSETDRNQIYERLCYAYLQSGENENAIREGEKVLKNDPGDFNAYYYLAKAYNATGNYSKALDFSENAKLVGMDKVRNSQDMQERMNMFQMIIEIGTIQENILNHYMDAKQYDEVISGAHKLLANDPQSLGTLLYLAKAYRASGKDEEAMKKLDEIGKLCEENKKNNENQPNRAMDDALITVGTIRGEMFNEQKQYPKAIEEYENAKKLAEANKKQEVVADLDSRLKKLAPHQPKASPSVKVEREEPKTPAPASSP